MQVCCSALALEARRLQNFQPSADSMLANSVPSINSYQSVALAFLPRPDGVTLIRSPDILAKNGQYSRVPMIIGDQENEGMLFSLNQYNISTTDQLVHTSKTSSSTTRPSHRSKPWYPSNLTTHPPVPHSAPVQSTTSTRNTNGWQLCSATYPSPSHDASCSPSPPKLAPSVPSWSYLTSYDYGTAVLGIFHIPTTYGEEQGIPSTAIQAYYLSFINQLNPNLGTVGELYWPQWSQGNMLMNFNAASNVPIPDNFREAVYNYITAAGAALYV